jgi:predicted nucleic acid-binding protein
MGAVLLDTTVVIDVLRGRPQTSARLLALQGAGDEPCICAVTAEEIAAHLAPKERERAAEFFSWIVPAPLGVTEGRLAGWWRHRYRQRGKTLSQADCLIAAAAVGIGARIATGNPKDFPQDDLQVEHWPVGV